VIFQDLFDMMPHLERSLERADEATTAVIMVDGSVES
jgi:hypothetical protein